MIIYKRYQCQKCGKTFDFLKANNQKKFCNQCSVELKYLYEYQANEQMEKILNEIRSISSMIKFFVIISVIEIICIILFFISYYAK